MKRLLHNIRFYILLASISLATILYVTTLGRINDATSLARLEDAYALCAAGSLYLVLSITPLTELFPTWKGRGQLVKSRRALGVSAFFFATLHAYLTFFKQLGGFEGLPYLSHTYLVAISLSFTALLILLLLVCTSTDGMLRRLGFKKWKSLHRWVYAAAVLVIIHALLLGRDFTTLQGFTAKFAFVLVTILAFFQASRIDRGMEKKWGVRRTFGLSTVIAASFFTLALAYFLPPTGSGSSSIHGQHVAEVQQAALNQVSAVLYVPSNSTSTLAYNLFLFGETTALTPDDVTGLPVVTVEGKNLSTRYINSRFEVILPELTPGEHILQIAVGLTGGSSEVIELPFSH